MPEININYWAVLVAGVVNIVFGMLWYGPIFGKKWMRLAGVTPESMKMSKTGAMFGGLIVSLVLAYVLAFDAFVWGDFFGAASGSVMFTFQLAFWIWLGYFVTVQAGAVLWEGKPKKLFLLNIAYWIIALFLMSLILTMWK